MKVKIMLETLSDIREFVSIASAIDACVHLTDGNRLTVSAKSILGAIYSMEWGNIYCTCDKDIYMAIRKFVAEE